MKEMAALTILSALLVLPGCFEVDVSFSRSKRGTVDGDPILNKAKATITGELLDPVTVDEPDKASQLASARLENLFVEVTDDAVDGVWDRDDLLFVYRVDAWVEPLEPDSDLPRILIAWYDIEEHEPVDPTLIEFEVDGSVEFIPYLKQGCRVVFESVTLIPHDDVSIRVTAEFGGTHEVL
jgi:hypothetical protein